MAISNYRYDPFDETFSAISIVDELHTVPASQQIILEEIPQYQVGDGLNIKYSSSSISFSEIFTGSPAAGEFIAIYGGDGVTVNGAVGQGSVLFNINDVGEDLKITYKGLGTTINKTLVDNLVPIGTIIAVDPDVKVAPDSLLWSLCDGTNDLPTDYFNRTTRPKLDDERFLMGATTYGSADNNNPTSSEISQTHKHQTGRAGSSALWMYNSSGVEQLIVYEDLSQLTTGSLHAQVSGQKTANLYSKDQTLVHSHTMDNKPSYFKVKYYIRKG